MATRFSSVIWLLPSRGSWPGTECAPVAPGPGRKRSLRGARELADAEKTRPRAIPEEKGGGFSDGLQFYFEI